VVRHRRLPVRQTHIDSSVPIRGHCVPSERTGSLGLSPVWEQARQEYGRDEQKDLALLTILILSLSSTHQQYCCSSPTVLVFQPLCRPSRGVSKHCADLKSAFAWPVFHSKVIIQFILCHWHSGPSTVQLGCEERTSAGRQRHPMIAMFLDFIRGM
jgi:hypothetical protein